MDIQALQQNLREFAAARNWQPFHTPKNLSTALMVEAAELAEIFQWMTTEESQAAHLYPATKERIGDEVADVLLYLLQVADHCAIDMPNAVANKWIKNAIKHPPAPSMAAHAKAPEPDRSEVAIAATAQISATASARTVQPTQQTHVLVDWENVQPKDQDIQALVPSATDVWLFHGPNQKNVAADQALFGQRATLVPIARAGKNALDFHLSFYMGYIAARNPHSNFVVISNDKGYAPMLEHASILGFTAQQLGFVSASGQVRKAAAVKTKKTVPAAQSAATPVPAKKASAKKQVASTPSKQTAPPRKTASVLQGVTVKKAAVAKPAVTEAVAVNPSKSPSAKAPKPAAVAGDKKTVARTVQPAAAPQSSVPPKRVKPQASKKPNPSDELDAAVRHVQASLQKTTNKPARKARLLAAITSLLNETSSDAVLVTEVLARLVSNGFVVVDEHGGVHFNP
ncbi:MAG TPA: PIN domain-containing protein [Rhodoferax sp.]|nr:PIN domain-containing protein [Rhodoferax sp.]